MIYTKDLLLRSIGNINEDLIAQINEDYIGIPRALHLAAIDIVLNMEDGEHGYTEATYPGIQQYHASIKVVSEALFQLKRQGFLSFGQQDNFTEKELTYGTHIRSMFDIGLA